MRAKHIIGDFEGTDFFDPQIVLSAAKGNFGVKFEVENRSGSRASMTKKL